MSLQTLTEDPDWNPTDHSESIQVFKQVAGTVTIKIWGADWCGDCQRELPLLSAVLAAAEIPETDIQQFPVDRHKQGPETDDYGIEYIPTIVIERDGQEIARFVEQADQPAVDTLAQQLTDIESVPDQD